MTVGTFQTSVFSRPNRPYLIPDSTLFFSDTILSLRGPGCCLSMEAVVGYERNTIRISVLWARWQIGR